MSVKSQSYDDELLVREQFLTGELHVNARTKPQYLDFQQLGKPSATHNLNANEVIFKSRPYATVFSRKSRRCMW